MILCKSLRNKLPCSKPPPPGHRTPPKNNPQAQALRAEASLKQLQARAAQDMGGVQGEVSTLQREIARLTEVGGGSVFFLYFSTFFFMFFLRIIYVCYTCMFSF